MLIALQTNPPLSEAKCLVTERGGSSGQRLSHITEGSFSDVTSTNVPVCKGGGWK